MKKVTLTVLGSLAAGTVAALLALPAGAGSTGGQTLHLLDVSAGDTPAFDAGHGAPRPGDRVYVHDVLYRWQGAKRGARVGHVEAALTFMSGFGRDGAMVDITGQVFLPSGSLRIEGIGQIPTDGRAHFVLPVVGGTGAYAGARGELDSRDLTANNGRSSFDLRLLP